MAVNQANEIAYTAPPGTTLVAWPVIAGLPVMKGFMVKGDAAVVLAKGLVAVKSILIPEPEDVFGCGSAVY